MSFNLAQTFFIDPSVVKNSAEVGISSVDLYFRAKPPINNNKSGIYAPGVEVRIVPCISGIPIFDETGVVRPTEPTEHGAKFAFYSTGKPARREWNEITPSTDASIATSFRFENPFFVKANMEFAILVKFDGNEDYVLWTSVSGNPLIGTTKASPGPSGQNIGNLYQYIGKLNPLAPFSNNVSTDPSNYLNTTISEKDVDKKYYESNLSAIKDTDLMFKIYVARYFINGAPSLSNVSIASNPFIQKSKDIAQLFVNATFNTTTNSYTVTAPADTLEFITYDEKYTNIANIFYGDLIYQNQPFYPGAGSANNLMGSNSVCTVSVIAGTSNSDIITANADYIFSNGVTFNNAGGFNNIYSGTYFDEYIVITSGNEVNVRKVLQIISNTQIQVDGALTITNNEAKFFKSPVGSLYTLGKNYAYNKTYNQITLNKSNANLDCRFVNNTIESVTIENGGSGYSNTDYIVISGYENIPTKIVGGYSATANIITDGSGSITQVMITNAGAGFVNTDLIVGSNLNIYNSSGGTSSGSSADLTFNVGATFKAHISSNTYFGNCVVINNEIDRLKPEITVNNPLGTVFNIKFRTLFHTFDDESTFSGKVFRLNENSSITDTPIKIFKSHSINVKNTAAMPSRSNEFIIPYANGSLANTQVIGREFSNSCVMLFEIASNNDFVAPFIDPDITRNHYSSYIINNDYTDEHTNYGNAQSKHVTTKINFAQNRLAEDLLVYLTAYRPANTDIKVYARVHNSKDPEAFDDKDWTLLELVDGVGVYSSKDNPSDYIELTYNFTQYPNTDYTLAGTSTVYKGQSYIEGSDTSFNNSSIYFTFNSNTDVANTTDFISIDNHTFSNNDQVTYYVAAGNTSISGLANNTLYYVVQANTAGIKLSSSKNGSAINITAGVTESGHSLYRTAVVPDDLIKIYSPLFPDNYAIHVVDRVVNSSYMTIKRSFGDLSANLVGTISVNDSDTTFDGISTEFNVDFSIGDFIAVWANSTTYEVRQITNIADSNTITVDSSFTFTNTTSNYAYVEGGDFVNNSISIPGNRIDRLEFKHQAFNYQASENVVRYYNNGMVEFSGYDTYQLKIILLSDSDTLVPKVDDVRSIGVSA